MNLVYRFGADGRLIFIEATITQLRQHVQCSDNQPESGGALLGRHLLDSSNLVVDEITVPQRKDKQRRFSFFRSKSHNDLAIQRWRETKGTMAYLGLWHTHPESVPTPSRTDLNDWEKASFGDSYEGDRLFFAIVGTEEIKVWSKTRTGPIEELLIERA
jgi:integrative and conjugative element protein (TIGR02256 family)